MKIQILLSLAALAGANSLQAQHGHLNAGAAGPNQNDPLIWANGAEFIASSGYVKTLDSTNAGRYAGHFQGNITLTALPATPAFGGPDPAAPVPGSFIQFRLACLDGPPGGTFNFWEADGTNPVVSLAPGQTSTNLWRLTQGDGALGTNLYGHIHGRRFSATKAGLYKIAFTAIDTSTNGAGGGPIHTPSVPLPVWFQAGVNVLSVEPDYEEGHVHVRFGAPAGFSWQMEASARLGPQANWQPAGNPVVGSDLLIELIHDSPPDGQRFYRVTGTPILP